MKTMTTLRNGLVVALICASANSYAASAGALLRVACDDAGAGAEVHVNGKFRGECPVEIQVTEGMQSVRVVKKVDAERERSFSQDIRVAAGTIKRVEVSLSPPRLNPEAQRREDERLRAVQAAAAEALRRDEAGAQAGDAAAMLALAERYAKGKGVARNDGEALAWYGKAADAGSTHAMTEMARRYESATGVARDFARARALYTKAAEAGDTEAMYELGVILQLGLGGVTSDEQAQAWYQRAAEAGSNKAATALGGILILKDEAQGVRWLRKAAEAGDPGAMNWLHMMHQHGVWGGSKDTQAAARWLERALTTYRADAEAGDVQAMAALAFILHASRPNEAGQWRSRAIERYRQQAGVGDARAMHALAGVYSIGGRDFTQSSQWYRKAADAGVVSAMTMLGMIYTHGQGVAKSEREAAAWYRKAAERGDGNAAKLLTHLNK